jgi:hypothetical protein
MPGPVGEVTAAGRRRVGNVSGREGRGADRHAAFLELLPQIVDLPAKPRYLLAPETPHRLIMRIMANTNTRQIAAQTSDLSSAPHTL